MTPDTLERLDPRQEAGKAFGRVALPTTLFFDSNGRLVSSRVGELSEATLEQRLRHQEAAEARIWAGIHYRFDIDAGEALGRAVAERVLARAGVTAAP